MDDFQQDFIRKVKNPTLEGEVVGSPSAPKKPIDKRWFIIIGLILILIITLIVLLIISNTNSSSQSPTSDPVSTENISSISWQCDDDTTITFDGEDGVIWASRASILDTTYSTNGSEISFGTVTGTIKDSVLTLKIPNGNIVKCSRRDA